MIDKELQADFLKNLRTKTRLSQREFGKQIGVSGAYIGQIETGTSTLSENSYKRITEIYKEYLSDVKPLDFVSITVRGNVSASMGYGIVVDDELKTGTYSISKQLTKDLGITPNNCEMIFASGDSMLPTIEGGDSLLIDRSRSEVYDGRIYCVRIEGQLYAKRLQKIPPSKIIVISDNPKYKSFEIDFSKQINFDFEIIGEVRWWGRVAR